MDTPHVNPVVPSGEGLRRAVRWISDQGHVDLPVVEQASVRFNLSPLDEDFLIRQFLHGEGIGGTD